MIIECINCNKKFEVNSELIPSSGRSIQCGSCNHLWFFEPGKIVSTNKKKLVNLNEDLSNISIPKIKKSKNKPAKKKDPSDIKDKRNYEITKYKAKTSFSISKFLSYILVLIITFVATIIIIDTFRSPIYQLFPDLELIIFSLFETLKDIKLFIKDLI